ncbi:MAG TPA: asparagine synthase-related protein [Aggregatilineales bacterium]|nr:asparagine synthase-related protein [Aggregatilineales bacterium]
MESNTLDYARLNGRFVLIFRDEQAQEWTFVTDRVGALHCYAVWHGERIVALGSDLAGLARRVSARKLDWEAITTFFSFGFFLDNRTYFTNIRVLNPRSLYRIGAMGDLHQHVCYWQWQHHVDRNRTYDETIEMYDALLHQAVQRCTTEERAVLPISGGLDSRSLVSVLPRDSAVETYSYGYSTDSIETNIAAQIADARQLEFTRHVISPYLFKRLPELVLALHGCQDVTQARQMSVNEWVKAHGSVVLTGLWGDVWCDQMGLADGLPQDLTVLAHTVKKFQKNGRAWLQENISTPQLENRDISQFLTSQIEAGLAEFDHIEDLDFRVKAYKTSRWSFRWSNASLRGFEVGATPRIAYYDVGLIDFFCTVPTAFIRDRRLQIDHLKRYAPDLARVYWQEAGANLYRAKYGYWLSLPRRAIRKAIRQVKHQSPVQRNWEVQFLSPEGQNGLRYWLLRPGLKLHDVVEPQAVESLLSAFYAQPNGANGYTVSILLTFSAWLETV